MRYLNEEEKKEILSSWSEIKKRQRDYSVPDIDIIPLCDALNKLNGVCTIQSCAGHPNTPNPDDSYYVQKAQLWLRLDEKVARKFYEHALELADNKLIEVVEILFHPKEELEGEIVSIIFEGNNSGKLSETSKIILSFFSKLVNIG